MAGAVITTRDMGRADIPEVATLEAAVYPEPWSPRVFFDELSRTNRSYLVMEDDTGAIVGYGGLLVVEEDAHITTLAVAPPVRGGGLGSRRMPTGEKPKRSYRS